MDKDDKADGQPVAAKAAPAAKARGDAGAGAGADADVQELLKAIPVFGRLLALLARRAGLAVGGGALLVLVVLPLLVPLLMSMYLRLLPEDLRTLYAKWLVGPLSVDENISRKVDDAVAAVVADNNLRLDFVQQFQHLWVKDGDWRTPVYAFPLSDQQEFNVDFDAQPGATKAACTEQKKIDAAAEALHGEGLFTIEVLGRKFVLDSIDNPTTLPFGETFWSDAKATRDLLKHKKATVQVVLNRRLATAVLECYPIRSNLLITVNKTIKPHKLERTGAPGSAGT